MLLSRTKGVGVGVAGLPGQPAVKKEKVVAKPKLSEFIENRDYTGAITLLEFNRRSGEETENSLQWLAYSCFHLGNYQKAIAHYYELRERSGDSVDPHIHTHIACCLFYLGLYKEAEEEANKSADSPLKTRVLFHIAHKLNDENKLMNFHQNLQDTIEDQLSLASIHYLRSHYQEAIDVYKRILLDHRDYLALNVYIALCYYKLDYYDVSHEVLTVYLHSKPDSAIAINLKACNHFRLYNGKAAESELGPLADSSYSGNFGSQLVKHNLVVFRNGENALQVLPPLIDVIPEARLNLVIYYLRNDEIEEAFNLIKDIEPTTPQEYTLKGVVHASYGQKHDSREHLKIAQQYFHLVGSSPSECDTIPGRQCMASCFFLLRQFEDVLIYLNSIKSYFYNDDDFNHNYAIAKAANGETKDAEEFFAVIQNESYKQDYCYLSWLARSFIANGKPREAWDLYLKMETSSESFSLLQLIANDCYRMGSFFFSAKAFDVLERLDPNPEYWEGKRGACVGVFQQILAGEESKESLRDVVAMLRNTSNLQVDYIIKTIKTWTRLNNIKI